MLGARNEPTAVSILKKSIISMVVHRIKTEGRFSLARFIVHPGRGTNFSLLDSV
jgi:hypothetical protein